MTAVMLLAVSSCVPEKGTEENLVTIDFDELILPECGYQNQVPYVDKDSTLQFSHFYTYYEEWDSESWCGFCVSSLKDTKTCGFGNQYSVSAGVAASGENFAVLFRDAYNASYNEMAFPAGEEHLFKSMALTNSTYVYLSMKEGDAFAKKFSDGDWFKLTISAYDAKAVKTNAMDVYLADFRQGRHELLNTWKTVDLSSLGKANRLAFEFSSSDNGQWGMNTPAYVCLDNIVYVK